MCMSQYQPADGDPADGRCARREVRVDFVIEGRQGMTAARKCAREPVRVLLIEDNPGDAGLVRAMLVRDLGARFSVEWVQDLQSGKARIALGEIDIVLLDLRFPTVKDWGA